MIILLSMIIVTLQGHCEFYHFDITTDDETREKRIDAPEGIESASLCPVKMISFPSSTEPLELMYIECRLVHSALPRPSLSPWIELRGHVMSEAPQHRYEE